MHKSKEVSLEEAQRLFLDDRHANNRAEGTIALYRRMLDSFIDWLKKRGYDLGDLKPLMVKQFIGHLRDEGTYNATSRQTICKVIQAWVNYLSDPDEHEHPIIERFKIKIPSAKSAKKYTPPPEAVDKLRAAANSSRSKIMLALLIDTGLRRKELCGLRWRDVDFEQGRIFVAEAKINSDEVCLGDTCLELLCEYQELQAYGEYLGVKQLHGKTEIPVYILMGGGRPKDPVIPKFPDRPWGTRPTLEEYKAYDKEIREMRENPAIEQFERDLVKRGVLDKFELDPPEVRLAAAQREWDAHVIESLNPTNITRILAKLSKRAGLEHPISPHALRRYYCTQLREDDVNVWKIMRLMRHRSITQTERYMADLPSRELSRAARRSSPYSALNGGNSLAD